MKAGGAFMIENRDLVLAAMFPEEAELVSHTSQARGKQLNTWEI